ncbi:hypothetical protein BOTNAR_0112g00150 [Botryotinia narcissicola]|uniref:Uncharacterized protein n=1 Tax=Botryotinia narcissicola TaxID=278944 RepID=A0A4Z1IMG2_9HELO|nr:hypothetical protein BOTNAR_0112g00150 [Botryotinia narcissicola]
MPEELTRRTQSDQTTGGGYEEVEHHDFKSINDDRYMSWRNGEDKKGSIIVNSGGEHCKRYSTKEPKEDFILYKGQAVLVMDTYFKLTTARASYEKV